MALYSYYIYPFRSNVVKCGQMWLNVVKCGKSTQLKRTLKERQNAKSTNPVEKETPEVTVDQVPRVYLRNSI